MHRACRTQYNCFPDLLARPIREVRKPQPSVAFTCHRAPFPSFLTADPSPNRRKKLRIPPTRLKPRSLPPRMWITSGRHHVTRLLSRLGVSIGRTAGEGMSTTPPGPPMPELMRIPRSSRQPGAWHRIQSAINVTCRPDDCGAHCYRSSSSPHGSSKRLCALRFLACTITINSDVRWVP